MASYWAGASDASDNVAQHAPIRLPAVISWHLGTRMYLGHVWDGSGKTWTSTTSAKEGFAPASVTTTRLEASDCSPLTMSLLSCWEFLDWWSGVPTLNRLLSFLMEYAPWVALARQPSCVLKCWWRPPGALNDRWHV